MLSMACVATPLSVGVWLLVPPVWRIFDLGVGVFVSATPSGFIPGGGAGARSSMSPSCGGGHQGPDCVSSFCPMFFFVILEAFSSKSWLVVLWMLLGPLCNLYPPFKLQLLGLWRP